MNESLVKLSIIILNYNSGNYLEKCLQSIWQSTLDKSFYEIIIADNASVDDSINLAKKYTSSHPDLNFQYQLLENNLGFAQGNNQAVKLISPTTEYVLFLNPDTDLDRNTLTKCLHFFISHPTADALTCKLILAQTGRLQPECHRGFPTPWRSFCYFTGLSQLFPKSKYFNGYFLGHLNLYKTHKIEACVGAFLMVKRKVGENLNWWSNKYFFYGEDLDFCYRLKQHHYNLFYYPYCKAVHYQGISSGLKTHSYKLSSATRQTRLRAAIASTQAMKIFYQENLFSQSNFLTKFLVNQGINLLQLFRIIKAKYF